MLSRRIFALLAALWLQVAPILVRLDGLASMVVQPIAMILRWAAGAAAVSGAFHAVSGATGLTITQPDGSETPPTTAINGKTGNAMTVKFFIQSDQHGTAKAYTYTSLPPGLTRSSVRTDTISGKPTQSGTYRTTIRGWENANASGDSYAAAVTFIITGSPPVITVQPANQTVDAGANATFTVFATGEAPITYQWFRDDAEIPGTGTNLVLTAVKADQAGRYRARARNAAGSTFSDFATLTVKAGATPPTVSLQAANYSGYLGDRIRPAVNVTPGSDGVAPAVTWQKDGTDLVGATGTPLVLTVTASTPGKYVAKVSGAGGTVFSPPIDVTLTPAPVVTGGIESSSFVVKFPSLAGRDYLLQSQSGLGGSWITKQTLTASGAQVNASVPLGIEPVFYRLVVVEQP